MTALKADPRDRVAELEAQLEQRDTRIRELRADLDRANAPYSQAARTVNEATDRDLVKEAKGLN